MKQKTIQNILIPVSCPSESEILLKQAIYFHEIFASKITIFLILPKVSIFDRAFNPKRRDPLHVKREAYSKLTRNTIAFFGKAIPGFIELKVEEGEFVNEIHRTQKSNKYDLLIIKEFSKIKNLLKKLKENSERIISDVECPVMIIHEKWTKIGIREILIPIDITQKCKNAVLWAVAVSLKLKAKIKFVSIVNYNITIEGSLVYKRSVLIKDWVNSQGIECDFEIIKSTPEKMAKSLLAYAEKGNADLIMILTHEEFIASHNYLGKFAKDVIHNSPKPVLSVVSHDKSMFKVVSGYNNYGPNRIEHLNIAKNDIKN